MGQQRILVGEMREGVERHRRDLVLPLECRAVQRFDIGEHLIDLKTAGVDRAAREAVKHEGIVRIGTMRDCDSLRHADLS